MFKRTRLLILMGVPHGAHESWSAGAWKPALNLEILLGIEFKQIEFFSTLLLWILIQCDHPILFSGPRISRIPFYVLDTSKLRIPLEFLPKCQNRHQSCHHKTAGHCACCNPRPRRRKQLQYRTVPHIVFPTSSHCPSQIRAKPLTVSIRKPNQWDLIYI